MKLKDLESLLQDCKGFERPRIELEQYVTPPHLAARFLFSIEQSYNDIESKNVADLGCGPGRLSVGASLLGADIVYGFDIDQYALDIFKENSLDSEVNNAETVLMDVTSLQNPTHSSFPGFFDTVVTNPPFGTKNNKGIDVQFLLAGLNLSNHAVYSFHKTSTRDFFMRKAREWKVDMEVIAEMKFDLSHTYSRHKQASVDIAVDLLRTVHKSK
ncbi:hypothetical protein RvY_05546 [Ramazzottius varieornatus]|uniref:Methyltransferase small domain-containing protein n=1 Tax=Ramazzottius varieornatus TaxID=947166 RepID=A0A1D1UVC3_RAMVA|nr:hypothetical protein RvY_05546 [Ramazzottius varieornatus]